MRNLPPEVRLKAIEIANALLEEGYDEGKAIRIAIAKAKGVGRAWQMAVVALITAQMLMNEAGTNRARPFFIS
jgi:uncharacterized protein YdaT